MIPSLGAASLGELEAFRRIAVGALQTPGGGTQRWALVEVDYERLEPSWWVYPPGRGSRLRVGVSTVFAGAWRIRVVPASVGPWVSPMTRLLVRNLAVGPEPDLLDEQGWSGSPFFTESRFPLWADQIVQVGLFGKVSYP